MTLLSRCRSQKEKERLEQDKRDGSAQSPRRVAVPVLVKDGKPCSNANERDSSTQQPPAASATTPAQQQQPPVTSHPAASAAAPSVPSPGEYQPMPDDLKTEEGKVSAYHMNALYPPGGNGLTAGSQGYLLNGRTW